MNDVTWLPNPSLQTKPTAQAPEKLMILYRGPLTSCNYDCSYCPFAKTHDSPETLAADRAALERFVEWASGQQPHRLTVLFTPWGEALTRSWYREAMIMLSHLPTVDRVAVQTNAAVRMDWTERADLDHLALWTTYHPEQVSHERFVLKARDLRERGIRHSVGVVGLPEHLPAAQRMRAELPTETYVWVNAAEGHSYTDETAAPWQAIDPLFALSRQPHPSAGRFCSAGRDAVTVDGNGTVRRCHFLPQAAAIIGNLYDDSYLDGLGPKPCPQGICDCHIGYLHLDHLGLREVFAGGWAERIPAGWPAAFRRAL